MRGEGGEDGGRGLKQPRGSPAGPATPAQLLLLQHPGPGPHWNAHSITQPLRCLRFASRVPRVCLGRASGVPRAGGTTTAPCLAVPGTSLHPAPLGCGRPALASQAGNRASSRSRPKLHTHPCRVHQPAAHTPAAPAAPALPVPAARPASMNGWVLETSQLPIKSVPEPLVPLRCDSGASRVCPRQAAPQHPIE